MFGVIKARINCFSTVSKYYSIIALKSDVLSPGGFYRAFWEIPNEKMLESVCDNIFSKHFEIRMYEWGQINPTM